MYRGIVYFRGPESTWSGKVSEKEIIADYGSKWLWAVRAMTLHAYSGLNLARCGYVLFEDETIVEHVEPPLGVVETES